jgi:hypothetical protein
LVAAAAGTDFEAKHFLLLLLQALAYGCFAEAEVLQTAVPRAWAQQRGMLPADHQQQCCPVQGPASW